MTKSDALRLVARTGCDLGEGPVWRPGDESLWFTDIIGRALLRWRAGDGVARIDLGYRVGSFAPIAGEDAVLAASERGLWRIEADFDVGRATRTSLGHDEAIVEGALMNDGGCDPGGRFVVGAKALDETRRLGRLLRHDGVRLEDATPAAVDGFVVFNGPAFSPDGRSMYFADTPSREIRVVAYDAETGPVGASRVFARLGGQDGYPDGMAVDAEGGLWNAHWDGARLTRYRPDGTIDRVVETPVSRPTSLAFGGTDGRTLFVTSAKRGRDDAPALTEPMAGDLFALDVDIPGAPVPEFEARSAGR